VNQVEIWVSFDSGLQKLVCRKILGLSENLYFQGVLYRNILEPAHVICWYADQLFERCKLLLTKLNKFVLRLRALSIFRLFLHKLEYSLHLLLAYCVW
jgi:hypothetical protein